MIGGPRIGVASGKYVTVHVQCTIGAYVKKVGPGTIIPIFTPGNARDGGVVI